MFSTIDFGSTLDDFLLEGGLDEALLSAFLDPSTADAGSVAFGEHHIQEPQPQTSWRQEIKRESDSNQSPCISSAWRCIDTSHHASCSTCREPPLPEDESRWELRGDPVRETLTRIFK